MCGNRKQVIIKEKRNYKEMIVEVSHSEAIALKNAQCIVNIAEDPEHSTLMTTIKDVEQQLRDQQSQPDDQQSKRSEILHDKLDLQLGQWYIQEVRPKILDHTTYIAHLKIDQTISREVLDKLYLELFTLISSKCIKSVALPQMWLDGSRISIKDNTYSLFEQMFTWRNQDQRDAVSFQVFHNDLDKCYTMVDCFLGLYNAFNPCPANGSSSQNPGEEDVDEDQKKLKSA